MNVRSGETAPDFLVETEKHKTKIMFSIQCRIHYS